MKKLDRDIQIQSLRFFYKFLWQVSKFQLNILLTMKTMKISSHFLRSPSSMKAKKNKNFHIFSVKMSLNVCIIQNIFIGESAYL